MWQRWQQQRRARAMLRRLEELDRLDRDHGLGSVPEGGYDGSYRSAPPGPGPSRTPSRRSRRKHRSGRRLGAELAAVSVALLVAMAVVLWRTDGSDGPQVADQEGQPYAFLATTRDGQPVGYDPCTPIRVAVNPQGAPEHYDELVDTGLRRVARQSGLTFERVGETDDRDFTDRKARFSATVSDPVLIAWSDAEEDPRLEGDVAGVGGSVSVRTDGERRYVTGSVVLDREAFGDDAFGLRSDALRTDRQSVLDHELGHLVGLDHVDDPGELMYGESVGREKFGPGDRQGLAILGDLPCA